MLLSGSWRRGPRAGDPTNRAGPQHLVCSPRLHTTASAHHGWKRWPNQGDNLLCVRIYGNDALPSQGLPASFLPKYIFSAPSLTALPAPRSLSHTGVGTTRCCHGEAVTSEELQGEVRGGAGRQGQHFQDAQGTPKGCEEWRVRKKNDLKISPFPESSRGSTWWSRHCRISAGLTVSLMSARLRNRRPAETGLTTAVPSEHCCALRPAPAITRDPPGTPKRLHSAPCFTDEEAEAQRGRLAAQGHHASA